MNELVAVVTTLIVPKLIIGQYGSEVNGLVISINQFLAFFGLCEAGIGPVIKANLYEPLAKNDDVGVSKVIKSTKRFFRVIAVIFIGYTLILTFLYPLISGSSKEFDLTYVITLLIILSVTTFIQYFFGLTNQILLTADQLAYIYLSTNAITLLGNTIFTAILIKMDASIHLVKLCSATIFALKPVVYAIYVKRNYKIDNNIILDEEPIKQKWNGMAQHICTVVQDKTDVILLTMFSSLSQVSVYSVYISVISGIRGIIYTANLSVSALFGNMIVKGENSTLKQTFSVFEWFLHTLTVLLFTVTGIMIIPFIKLYTAGIKDVEYCVPVFSVLIVICGGLRCLQLCYNIVVQSAGKFKETQKATAIEPIINIVVSIMFVIKYDLIGVTIGTIVSLVYRLIYLILYVRKNLISISLKSTLKQFCVDILNVGAIIGGTMFISTDVNSYWFWVICAIKVTLIATIISIAINLLFYRDSIKFFVSKLESKRAKRWDNAR